MMNPILLIVKVTVILGLAALFLPLMRRMPAAARYFLCLAALAASVALPLFSVIPPIHIPAVHLFTMATGSILINRNAQIPLVRWFWVIWAGGTLAVISRLSLGILYLDRRTRLAMESDPLPDELDRLIRKHRASIRFASVTTPVVWGVFHPEVLLPESACSWPEGRLRFAVLHELAHLDRRDLWTALIPMAAQAFYWFHPLVWWLSAEASEAQELACDEHVLSRGASAPEYASLIVETARQLSSPILFGCPMVSRSHSLRGRIMHILQFRSNSRPGRFSRAVAYLFPALLIGAGLMLATDHQDSTKPDKVYKIGGDVKPPLVVSKVEPQYTQEAKDAKIQGKALLSVIIDASGVTHDVQVIKSLDPGLDANAIDAIQQWRFSPATKDGQPVAVEAHVEVNFRLK